MTVRVNLGCGRRPMDGWVNVNDVDLPGVDVVADLDREISTDITADIMVPLIHEAGQTAAEVAQASRDFMGSVTEFHMSHVLEHLHHPLPLMEACYILAKPDATFTILCPHGASDDADEDPTHVRRLYPGSFQYFAQPTYWRADYGYRGDWQPETIELKLRPGSYEGCVTTEDLVERVASRRNVVAEMEVRLRAVKPARVPGNRADMVPAELTFSEAVAG